MRKQKSTEYSYWKWAILQRLNTIHENEILIHDQQENKILTYNIKTKQIMPREYDFILDGVFKTKMIGVILTNEQAEPFYNDLPEKYKKVFIESIR